MLIDISSRQCVPTLSNNTNSRTFRRQLSIIQRRTLFTPLMIAVCCMIATTTLHRNINSSKAFILLPKLQSISSITRKTTSVINNNHPNFRLNYLHQTSKDTTTTESIPIPPVDTAARNIMNDIPTIPPLSKTAKRVYWIRHGEVINPGIGQNKSVFYGSMDVSLSSLGQQEAIAAGKFLSQYDDNVVSGPLLSKIYSSNLTRAIYGAEQVRIQQKQQQQQQDDDEGTISPLEVIQVPGFMELNRGEWCGKTIQEIGQEQMEKFNNCDESVTPINGESYHEFNDRVIQARDEIVLQQLEMGQCAAVVSHLQVTRCVVADALQKPLHEVSKISIATASITCIDYEYDKGESSDATNNVENYCAKLPQKQMIHFQSYKPDIGLRKSMDGAN